MFTATSLLELINAHAVVRDVSIRPNDPGLADLASAVNRLISASIYSRVLWQQENERLDLVKPAIQTLIDILPLISPDYVEAHKDIRRLGPAPSLTEVTLHQRTVERDLAALEGLFNAAVEAQRLGLPRRFLRADPRYATWMDCARDLEMFFHSYLPGHSKAAAYRFVQAVSPKVTHDSPTYQAVESHLKKRRDVNRGRRRTPLPRGQTKK